MELIAIWQLVRRRWWLILLPAIVVLVLTLPQLSNIIRPPVSYVVQMRLTAAAPPTDASTDSTAPYEDSAYVPWLASEYVVINLPHWVTSDSFSREVQQVLDAQQNPIADDDLNGAFHADGFRSILTLYVVWDDPAEIVPLAEAAVEVLQTRNQQYFSQLATEPVTVTPLDDIEVGELAPPITARLNPLLRIAVGLAAGIALAVLAEYLDTSLRTPEEVEALGLPVVAVIPPER